MNCTADNILEKILRASPSCNFPASSIEPPITTIKVSSFDWNTTDFKQRTDTDNNYYNNNNIILILCTRLFLFSWRLAIFTACEELSLLKLNEVLQSNSLIWRQDERCAPRLYLHLQKAICLLLHLKRKTLVHHLMLGATGSGWMQKQYLQLLHSLENNNYAT